MTVIPLDILRCPKSGERLQRAGDTLSTEDGAQRYPIADGVPILVHDTLSIFSAAEIEARGIAGSRMGRRRRLARRLIPGKTLVINTPERFAAFEREVCQRSGDRQPLVLVVGGGKAGVGMDGLLRSSAIAFIETDIYLGPRVSLVCDGHHLPFADGTFDGVIIQAVLEHVLDPPRVVSEIHRVLREGGVVYAETPFMQQVHEGPFDFTRWTETGHRRLFRMFRELDRGIVAGPGTTLLWALCYFARSIPKKRSSLQLVLEKLVIVGFFWLKYFDRVLIDHAGASDSASGVFFMGCKANEPVSDADVLANYRGAVGPPMRRSSS